MSKFSQIVPLILLFVVLAAFAFIGYQVYLSVAKIQAQASERMGAKNVVFTKDGLRVGVKHVENEKVIDDTRSYMVKAWNLASESQQGPSNGAKLQKRK